MERRPGRPSSDGRTARLSLPEVQAIHERLRAARRLLVTTLAGSGVLLWLAVLWPRQRMHLQALAIPFWILVLPAMTAFWVRELLWRCRCSRVLGSGRNNYPSSRDRMIDRRAGVIAARTRDRG
jgi:hypothetical protein